MIYDVMMPLLSRVARLVALVALVAAAGCREPVLSLEERIERAGQLPGVRASTHSELRAEFRRVEQSHGLPEQLQDEPVPSHQNAAVALAKVWDDDDRVASLNQQAASFLGAVRPANSEFVATEAATLAARWLQPMGQVAKLSQLEQCQFGLEYARGFFNDVRFLDQAAAACRLLLVEGLAQLEADPDLAMDRFRLAWRWTDWLAAERYLESRLKAVELRTEAIAVAEHFANRPQATRQELRLLHQCFVRSIAATPRLEETLQRERAIALVTYEAIRLGLVNLLFTDEERQELQTDEVLELLRKASPDRIDADEAAYLQYMRQVLATAGEPYHARKGGLAESDRLLASTAVGEDYAWFANRLFAENLTLAQAELARDQARLEGWVLALARAADLPAPGFKTHPRNGKPYRIETVGGEVHVDLSDRRTANPRVRVPQK